MSNKNYGRGRQFEYTVLNKLIEQGYDGIRSAGSHSPIDLLVWKESKFSHLVYNTKQNAGNYYLDLFAIQCKHSKVEDVSFTSLLKDDNVIKLAAMPDNFTKVLCIKQPRSRTIIQLVYDNTSWKFRKIFDI